MIRLALLGAVAIVTAAITGPSLAHANIQEPGALAFGDRNGDPQIASTSLRQENAVVAQGTMNAMAAAPSSRASTKGRETTTRPWAAPVGHRQPRTGDVPAPAPSSQFSLDQEDASVDRKISNVCRGC
jgi:hypothetical protein